MAIDEVPVQQTNVEPSPNTGQSVALIVAFLVLTALAVAEFVTIHKVNVMRDDFVAQQKQLRTDITAQFRDQVSGRLTALEQQNGQELDAIRTELDKASKRVGAQSGELRRARKMVADLQNQQRAQTDLLKRELDSKADQEQVGALSADVSSTKSDLNTTKANVNTLASDLGMARSNMGTLIARNHDDIVYLRKLGDRDYFEFQLTKNKPDKVGGIGLTLKKTNWKHHQFNVATLVDDLLVERKDCVVNSPVFFYVNGSRKPYELVVNSVGSNEVKGYLSTPKGVTEVAARSEGAR